ncbi:MAG: hypothetical protein LBG80_16065 [Bacteroidales bacterium]|jgi:hypothetical protein|nr:hypothetical protein [Bacteroidales bacterium]
MINIDDKIKKLSSKTEAKDPVKIAITGLGSVGNYLLNYLIDFDYPLQVSLIGRSKEKMQSDMNIALIASNIRRRQFISYKIFEADLNNVQQLSEVIKSIDPDFIVNSSRAYSNIKYGSISWHTVRAYGLWSPLSVRFIKNIMAAVEFSGTAPIVINTSYSDAVNAWLKTSGKPYPDFGSGNLNHLIPRIRLAIAKSQNITDCNNIEITLATSHFHDVVISKEGHTEGVDPLIHIGYKGQQLSLDMESIYKACAIPMPIDTKRNMMNASSNYEIITTVLKACLTKTKHILHIPGAMGMIGGYPVMVNGEANTVSVNEEYFTLSQMQEVNRKSIYLDGIENVKDGFLIYTNELIEKVKKAFNYGVPKTVSINDSDSIAEEIIKNIIEKYK